jgi:hypothetical protein
MYAVLSAPHGWSLQHGRAKAAIGAARGLPGRFNPPAAKQAEPPKRSFRSVGPSKPTSPSTFAQVLAGPPKQRRKIDIERCVVNAKQRSAKPLLSSGPGLGTMLGQSASMFSKALVGSSGGGCQGLQPEKKMAAIGAPSPQPLHTKAGQQGLKGSLASPGSTTPRPPPPNVVAMPPKKGQKRKLGHEDVDSTPGSVHESGLAHLRRHTAQGHATSCLRCRYLADPRKLEQYAMMPQTCGKAETWLEPRPEYKGGPWGLGCRVCAWHGPHKRPCWAHKAPGGKRRKHRKNPLLGIAPAIGGHFREQLPRGRGQARFGKFANFKWSATSQVAKNLEQHGTSKAHEAACAAMRRKACGLEAGKTGSSGSAIPEPPTADPFHERTFKGRVPKPQDWLGAFVESSNLVSWSKQARLCIGKSGQKPITVAGEPVATPKASKQEQPVVVPKACKQGQPLAAPRASVENLRKRRRKQTRIMAECIRKRHRKVLREAHFCSLALDEAQGRKLVRFRCDFPKPPWNYSGTLGVFQMGPKTVEEAEEDHAQRAMTRLDEFITKFCTPLRKARLGTECDQELKDHLLKIVKTISADGGAAERRAIYLACELGFPARSHCAAYHRPRRHGFAKTAYRGFLLGFAYSVPHKFWIGGSVWGQIWGATYPTFPWGTRYCALHGVPQTVYQGGHVPRAWGP